MPTVLFHGTDGSIDTWELNRFLYLLRVAYVVMVEKEREDKALSWEEFRWSAAGRTEFSHRSYSGLILARIYDTDLGEEELRIEKISKQSPLEISFTAIVACLAAAVVLSGGKADLKNLKFEVPPLGDGIRKLREAFGLKPPRKRKAYKPTRKKNKRTTDE